MITVINGSFVQVLLLHYMTFLQQLRQHIEVESSRQQFFVENSYLKRAPGSASDEGPAASSALIDGKHLR